MIKDNQGRVDIWREFSGGIGSEVQKLKRKGLMTVDETEELDVWLPARKKHEVARRKSEEVMSEAWRARRRLQEKNAGRWTDGTLRMNRLWEGFHWVLNVDGPEDAEW
jgi:hypothetical protein